MEYLKPLLFSKDISRQLKQNSNYLFDIIPELTFMVDFPHNHPHHHLDVWEHTLKTLENSPPEYNIRLALLLHDIGKPFSYQDEEVRHFRGHAQKSCEMARDILDRVECENSEYILKLIEKHDTLMTMQEVEQDFDFCNDLFIMHYCDGMAHHPDKLTKRKTLLREELSNIRSVAKESGKIINIPHDIENSLAAETQTQPPQQ